MLALLPRPPIAPLLTLNLIPTIITLRSALLGKPHPLDVASLAISIVYWAAMMSVPYTSAMDGLFYGARSRGGGSASSFGTSLPKHIEEPTSAFSRALYTFMLPFLIRHYRTPITLKDIPALREDDASASALGAFRADQAYRDAKWAEKHLGEKRPRDLGFDLFRFFLPEISAQCVSVERGELLMNRCGL